MELVIESKFRIFITTSEVFLKHFRTFRSFNQVTISATIHRREKLKSTNVLDSKFHPVIDFADRYLPTRNFQSQYKKYKKLLTIGNFKHWILYWINGFHVRRKKEYDETRQRKRNIVRKNKKIIKKEGYSDENRGSKNIRAHVEISLWFVRTTRTGLDSSPEGRSPYRIVAKTCPLPSIYGALWKIRAPCFAQCP